MSREQGSLMPGLAQRRGQGMAYDLKHRTTKTVVKGMNFPLGASLTPDGVNFALYSKNATEVFLLLFDKPDGEPTDIIQLGNRDKFIWHSFFFFNDTATTEIYTLSLHDALPISPPSMME